MDVPRCYACRRRRSAGRFRAGTYADPVAPPADTSTSELVARARDGDEESWRQLVHRMKNVVWKTVNGFNMPTGDTEDAFAATMFRLAENLDRIRDPERLPGWLATTARNESLALLRARRRTVVMDEVPEDGGDPGDHETNLVLDELRQAVREAFATLGRECQQLLRLLTGDPPMQYRDIAEHLGVPIGSIGPTRQRCLQKLRSQQSLQSYMAGTQR